MINRRRWAFVYMFCILFNDIVAVHHWKVSDNGKQIEAVEDSAFTVTYAGSLLDFLSQYDNIKLLGQTTKELKNTMKTIDKREKEDEPDVEDRIRKNNPHCKAAEPLEINDFSFRTTYTGEFCPEYHALHARNVLVVKDSDFESGDSDPICANFHPLYDFGEFDVDSVIYTQDLDEFLKYEQLLKMYYVYLYPTGTNLNQISQLLTYLLKHSDKSVSQNPYLHMACAAYWRLGRDFKNAYKCYQSAAYYINERANNGNLKSDSYLQLHLALSNLLQKAVKSKEAAEFIEKVHLHANLRKMLPCFQSSLYAATGDIAMTLGRQHKSQIFPIDDGDNHKVAETHYRKAIEVQIGVAVDHVPMEWGSIIEHVHVKIAYINCMFALSSKLENQKNNLEKLVKDKHHFNKIYENLKTIEKTVGQRFVTPEDRLIFRSGYEMTKYGYNPHSECYSTIAKRFVLSSNPNDITGLIVCSINDAQLYEEHFIAKRKETVKNRPTLNDTNWRVVELFARDRNFEKKLKQLRETQTDIPTFKQESKQNIMYSAVNRYWRRADWPNSVDCQMIISRSDLFDSAMFPQIILSFEDRGVLVSELLTKSIGLEFHEEHPLPWEEPFCNQEDVDKNPLLTFKGFVEMLDMPHSKPEYSEQKLKTTFVRLSDKIMEDIEVAQRIRTLLYNDIGPKWVALNLAAMYWRIKGNPRQTALCLASAVMKKEEMSDIALTQLAQALYVTTGRRDEAINILDMADGITKAQPQIPWLQGRLHLLRTEVDDAVRRFKEAMDRDPLNEKISEDLLKVACSGKSSRPAISSRFPTVCCSIYVHNAVCFKDEKLGEQCFVVDPETQYLVYHRCNGVYMGFSYKPPPYVYIISPFLPIFNTVSKNILPPFEDDTGGVQTIETKELPLDYGGSAAFFLKPPPFWWTNTQNEVRYETKREVEVDSWEIESTSDLAALPPKPLSFLWVRDKKEMLKWDIKLPNVLPAPFPHQIRKGLSRFPPPRKTLNMCNGVNKLSVLLENLSTWVSVTAKGEDIEKYVDLRGPVPGIAGLQPVCPTIGVSNSSPILGLDHIPAFALSDQFLFYKPEKMLTEALKTLGNERDSIEHVAARLHTAMVSEGVGQKGNVNWLLCVLSSLYWRVVGDAPRAVGCLRCALQTAPSHMRDVVLVSLANVCHQAGLLNSALIAAGAALSASPNLVAIHFTIANIYASIGDYQKALEFYYSTLSLQGNFEPAKERIRAIYCNVDESFAFQGI